MTALAAETLAKVAVLTELIDAAYGLYFDHHPDQYYKSSEGYVSLHLGTTFDRRDGLRPMRVSVYSYVFGPGRQHDFESVDDALAAVREWVDRYRAWLLCDECGTPAQVGDGWEEVKRCPNGHVEGAA